MSESVRRALISVYDKTGVVELGRALAGMGIEILSSGGTARLLGEHGVAVMPVSEYTGFPELLDGRVKTLHPRIHGGILAVRSNERHREELRQAGIGPIDLVVVNLYPFEKTTAIEGIGLGEVVEMIDIGGPSMVRAAAKNFAHVGVVVDPADYAAVLEELRRDGALSATTRHRLAVEAFRHTAAYDTAIHAWLGRVGPGGEVGRDEAPLPPTLRLEYVKAQELRYGENPHQRAAFYREPASRGPGVAQAAQLQGKELSFNNILDLDAALGLVVELGQSACAIIKHGNPCGAATGSEPVAAFKRALECDPLSAFGGVIAFNREVDRRTAEALTEQFYECVIAPGFDAEARAVLANKTRLRLLAVGPLPPVVRRQGLDLRRVAGGVLAQDWDQADERVRDSRVVSERRPGSEEWQALEFAWIVARHVKSNAIVYARADRTVGIGAGQMSRVDAVRFGALKASTPLDGAVMASDAFFPFRDGIDAAAEAGVRAVVQPGGSLRDDEVVAAANEHGMAMVFTGRRHFRH